MVWMRQIWQACPKVRRVLQHFRRTHVIAACVIAPLLAVSSTSADTPAGPTTVTPLPQIAPSIALTAEEQEFLSANRVIRLGVTPDYPPFDLIDEQGRHAGIAADLLRKVEASLGIELRLIKTSSWEETLRFTREGRIDMISALAETPARSEFLAFTRPYLTYPIVVVTEASAPFMDGVADLAGRTVAMPRDVFGVDWLARNHPTVNVSLYPSLDDALRAVSSGRADATIENLAVVTYRIRTLGLVNLKVAARGWQDGGMAVGVRKDWPLLASALDKALAAIPARDRQAAYDKWAAVTDERKLDLTEALTYLVPVVTTLLVVIGVVGFSNRRLSQEVALRTAAEAETRAQAERAEAALRDLRLAKDRLVQSEKLASMGRMVAGVAHEMNTPLGILIAAASAVEDDTRHVTMELQDERLDRDTLAEFLQRVERASAMQERTLKRMASLVDRFKRLAEHDAMAKPELVALLPLCLELTQTLASEVETLGHTLIVTGDNEAQVMTHREVLSDVIIGLVDNALKHAYKLGTKGEVRIIVENTADGAIITVADSGCGIAPEMQRAMFDPFVTTGRGSGHLGLGLAIALNQVTIQLCGRLDLASAPGLGSSFMIRLPWSCEATVSASGAKDVDAGKGVGGVETVARPAAE